MPALRPVPALVPADGTTRPALPTLYAGTAWACPSMHSIHSRRSSSEDARSR